jgi:predicted Zn-dependent protease
MTKYEFLSIIDKLNRYDYTKAKVISYKVVDGDLKITSSDQGEQFEVCLIKDDGGGFVCVNTTSSYEEASQLAEDLNDWLYEEDWEQAKETFEL